MSAGPPFYVLVLCLALPLLYSLPTALLSAELATNYPETGGQCVYVTLACGSVLGVRCLAPVAALARTRRGSLLGAECRFVRPRTQQACRRFCARSVCRGRGGDLPR